MQRPLWHKLVAWALALALAGAAATLVVGDEQPASGAPDALGSADRARLAVAGLAGLSLFLIATLHQERKGESADSTPKRLRLRKMATTNPSPLAFPQ